MVCEQLLEAVTETTMQVDADWIDNCVALQKRISAQYTCDPANEAIHPFVACQLVAKSYGAEAVYVLDGGEAAAWGSHNCRVNKVGHVIGQGYLGCLGTGPGHAIGAKIATPQNDVVQITGDGAMGFHIAEFDIMVRHKLNVVTVILNNQVWGMSLHGQQIMYGANYSAISQLPGTHYAEIARAFGCEAVRVSTVSELRDALELYKNPHSPVCIEVMTSPDVVHPGTVNALGKVREGESATLIPYYENIPN